MVVPRSGLPKKVFFLIFNLSGGGAERNVLRVLSRLDRERFIPVLVLKETKGAFLPDLPSDVRVLDCGGGRPGGRWRWAPELARILRSERPDVIVSFMWYANLVAIIAKRLSGIRAPLLVCERTTIVGAHLGFFQDRLRRLVIRFLYPRAERVLANSRGLRAQLLARYRFPEGRVTYLPNPLDIERIGELSRDLSPRDAVGGAHPGVVGVGRFTREKGFDLLVRAMSMVGTPSRLLLVGEGPERGALEDLARRTGIADRVEFTGFLRNPYPRVRAASVFVLPSRFEGFPNALLEAMSLGKACVSTRCPTGPEEIVTDGVDGLLVPVEDPAVLAEAIDRLLCDVALRQRLGEAAKVRVREFEAGEIVHRFEELLLEVAG